jgi:nitrate reductase NapE component
MFPLSAGCFSNLFGFNFRLKKIFKKCKTSNEDVPTSNKQRQYLAFVCSLLIITAFLVIALAMIGAIGFALHARMEKHDF